MSDAREITISFSSDWRVEQERTEEDRSSWDEVGCLPAFVATDVLQDLPAGLVGLDDTQQSIVIHIRETAAQYGEFAKAPGRRRCLGGGYIPFRHASPQPVISAFEFLSGLRAAWIDRTGAKPLPAHTDQLDGIRALADQFVAEVRELSQVRRVLLQRTPSPQIWTIIEAEPFDFSNRQPVYKSQLAALEAYPKQSVEFHLINLAEYSDVCEDQLVPPNSEVIWEAAAGR